MTRESDLGNLFSIDVDAEVRKLCGRQFASDVDRLAEMVRTAIAQGAVEVHLEFGRRKVVLDATGAHFPAPLLDTLYEIRNPQAPAARRHAAVVACERGAGLGLLALLAEPHLRILSGGQQLLIAPGRVRRGERRGGRSGDGLRIEIRRRTTAAEIAQLKRACRYSRVPIHIDNQRCSHAGESAEAIVSLQFRTDAFEGWVGVPRDDELCRTAYLYREVIHRETVGVSGRGFSHVAAVWARQARSGEEIPLADISRAVRSVRVDLYRRLPQLLPTLADADQRAVRNLLFRRCERSRDPEPLRGLAIFRRLAGEPVAIETVRATATERTILAVEAGAAPKPWIADPRRVFCLDERERGLLSDLLGLAVVEPPVRVPDSAWRRLRGRLRNGTVAVLRLTQRVIGYLLAGRQVDPALLTAQEQHFVAAVETELGSGRFLLPGISWELSRRMPVVMIDRGSLPARVVRHGNHRALEVPRGDRVLRDAVAAVAVDPGNVYPALALVMGGYDGFGARKRAHQEALLVPR